MRSGDEDVDILGSHYYVHQVCSGHGVCSHKRKKDTVPDPMDVRFRVKHISLHDIFSARVGCGAVHI